MTERPCAGYPGVQQAGPERPGASGGFADRSRTESSLATATNVGAQRRERE